MRRSKPKSTTYARLRGQGLTLTQQSAIDLLASGKNDTETAALLNSHRTTITNWRLKDPEFIAALNTKRAEIWGAAADLLRNLIPKALKVLAEEMEQTESAERRARAAAALLKACPVGSDAMRIGPTEPEEVIAEMVEKEDIVRRQREREDAQERQEILERMDPLERAFGDPPIIIFADRAKKKEKELKAEAMSKEEGEAKN